MISVCTSCCATYPFSISSASCFRSTSAAGAKEDERRMSTGNPKRSIRRFQGSLRKRSRAVHVEPRHSGIAGIAVGDEDRALGESELPRTISWAKTRISTSMGRPQLALSAATPTPNHVDSVDSSARWEITGSYCRRANSSWRFASEARRSPEKSVPTCLLIPRFAACPDRHPSGHGPRSQNL